MKRSTILPKKLTTQKIGLTHVMILDSILSHNDENTGEPKATPKRKLTKIDHDIEPITVGEYNSIKEN